MPPDPDEREEALSAAVEERTRSGQYPPDLDEELTRHYEEILRGRRGTQSASVFDALLARVDDASDFRPERIPYSSRVPLGSQLHRTIGKIVRRQTAGILGQLDRYAAAVRELLAQVVDQVADEGLLRESSTQLNARLDAVLDQVARRSPAVERTPRDAGWPPEPALTEFLDGSRDDVLARNAELADALAAAPPVLVLGCGRGELLELLAQRGAEATGVEAAPELVALCLARGLAAEAGDPLDRLSAAPASSLGAVYAGRLPGRLDARGCADLVLAAAAKLRAGGRLVARELEPGPSGAEAWADPLRRRLVPSRYLAFLCRQAGFAEVAVETAGATYTLTATR